MNAVDGSQHYEQASTEQNPSLLTVILDINPAAWSLLSETLSFSRAIGNIIIFLNAHLACNYTNKVAVIASCQGCSQWLYPSPTPQYRPKPKPGKRKPEDFPAESADKGASDSPKRLKLNGPRDEGSGLKLKLKLNQAAPKRENDKYLPFRIVEEELLRNLTEMLATMDISSVSTTASTQVAGALTLALSYINRQKLAVAETAGRPTNSLDATSSSITANAADTNNKTVLHSRILFISVSPSHDLAHQYIPIMNAIFACQRLSIPIDICQIPIPNSKPSPAVFLQQACDATKGIYIPPQRCNIRGISAVSNDGIPANSIFAAALGASDPCRCGFSGSVLLPPTCGRYGICLQYLSEHLLLCARECGVLDMWHAIRVG